MLFRQPVRKIPRITAASVAEAEQFLVDKDRGRDSDMMTGVTRALRVSNAVRQPCQAVESCGRELMRAEGAIVASPM